MVKSKVEQLSSIPSPNGVFDSILKVFEALGPPLLSHMVKRGDRGREAQVISIMSILGKFESPLPVVAIHV